MHAGRDPRRSPAFGTAWGAEELFVANYDGDSVTVYGRTAAGDTAPLRTLAGFDTYLVQPFALFADTLNDELPRSGPVQPYRLPAQRGRRGRADPRPADDRIAGGTGG